MIKIRFFQPLDKWNNEKLKIDTFNVHEKRQFLLCLKNFLEDFDKKHLE